MSDKVWSLLTGFLFSSPGMALCAAIGTGTMLVLTRLTTALSPYAPLSYGLVALVSTIAFLIIFFVLLNLNERTKTRKRTSIDISVANGTLGVSETSNIEDQRSFNMQGTIAYLFTFKRPIAPGHVIHIDGIRNAIPKIERQYVTSKAACIFLTQIGPECAFRLTFNKDLEAQA